MCLPGLGAEVPDMGDGSLYGVAALAGKSVLTFKSSCFTKLCFNFSGDAIATRQNGALLICNAFGRITTHPNAPAQIAQNNQLRMPLPEDMPTF